MLFFFHNLIEPQVRHLPWSPHWPPKINIKRPLTSHRRSVVPCHSGHMIGHCNSHSAPRVSFQKQQDSSPIPRATDWITTVAYVAPRHNPSRPRHLWRVLVLTATPLSFLWPVAFLCHIQFRRKRKHLQSVTTKSMSQNGVPLTPYQAPRQDISPAIRPGPFNNLARASFHLGVAQASFPSHNSSRSLCGKLSSSLSLPLVPSPPISRSEPPSATTSP